MENPRFSRHFVLTIQPTGGIRIRVFMAMITLSKPVHRRRSRLSAALSALLGQLRRHAAARRRRQATIDLIHASPHLLADIGATEEHFSRRGR